MQVLFLIFGKIKEIVIILLSKTGKNTHKNICRKRKTKIIDNNKKIGLCKNFIFTN